MDIRDLAIDPSRIEGGEWIGDLPGMGHLRLKVRGLSSRKAQALRALKMRQLPRRDREPDGSPKHDAAHRITLEVLLEAVLLDWDGLTDGGKPVKYSEKQAREWLFDPRFERFGDAVVQAASIVDNLQEERVEEIEKNL